MSPNYRKTTQTTCRKIRIIRYFEAPNARIGSILWHAKVTYRKKWLSRDKSENFGTIKGQQVMMQYIQKGEMALQQGMESEAINSFSMAACISYIGQGMIHYYD